MTYGERNLRRVQALPDGYPNKNAIVTHWYREVRAERNGAAVEQERKEYEEAGLEYPF